jgi:putative chitinase
MPVTEEQMQRMFPSTPITAIDELLNPLNMTLQEYNIDNLNRIAMFIAQCGHESGGFRVKEENLNYRPERLAVIFPTHFRGVDVHEYAHNPQKIANRVYANRMGNGPESSGDGYNFRGRGFIQLTGRSNYTKFAKDNDLSLEEAVEYMGTVAGSIHSAGWFWNEHNLNEPSDLDDVITVTKKINGGTLGLTEREELYHNGLVIFQ